MEDLSGCSVNLFDDNLVTETPEMEVQRMELRAQILDYKGQMQDGTAKNLWMHGLPASGLSFLLEVCFGEVHEFEGPEDTYAGPNPTLAWIDTFDYGWFRSRTANNLIMVGSPISLDRRFEGEQLEKMKETFVEIHVPIIE